MKWLTHPLVILFALAGCAGEDRPAPPPAAIIPTEVVVTPPALDLIAGTGGQLGAQSNDGAGQPIGGAPITFSTDTPELLRVSDSGYVSSVGPAGQGFVSVVSGPTARKIEVRIVPGDAVKLEAIGTFAEPGRVGERLPDPVQVRVVDGFGNPVPGAAVQFEAPTQGSVLTPASIAADAAGLAGTAWTLGTVAGPQVLRAFVAGTATLELSVPAGPALPETLEPSGMITPAVAGAPVRLAVIVRDRYGNAVPGVTVGWSTGAGKASLPTPGSVTNESGIAETTVVTAPAVGLATVVARLAGRDDLSATVSVTSVAGPATSVAIHSGDHQTAKAGSAVKQRPTVLIADINGNPVAGAVVTFAVTREEGSVEGNTQTTGADGLAAPDQWTLGAAGENQLQATLAGVAEGATFSAKATP